MTGGDGQLVVERRRRRDEPVRVAVVGTGAMGANHARVYSGLKGADLVAVVDTDLDRARTVAELYGTRAVASVDEVVHLLDAVSVTVPSAAHADVGVPLLERGVACLVEKPLSTTAEGARALIEASRRSGAPLLAGHIERFNPAVAQLRGILAGSHVVLAVETRRMSAVSGRVTDVDVVTDLMVHDLDIVLDLVRSEVVNVTARGVLRTGSPGDDFVTALLTFANGALAVLTASRVTQNSIRQLQVTTDSRFFSVDYPNQELLIFRQGRLGLLGDNPGDDSQYVLDVGTERVFVRRTEPLAAELTHFLAVAQKKAAPLVTGEAGLAAMELVWEIRRQVGTASVAG